MLRALFYWGAVAPNAQEDRLSREYERNMQGAWQFRDAMCFSHRIKHGDGNALLLWSDNFIKTVPSLQDLLHHGRVLVTHRTLLVGLRNNVTQIGR